MTPLPILDPNGIWQITYFVALFAFIPFFVNMLIGRIFPISTQILWAYLLVRALFIFEWPSAHYGVYTSYFQSTAGQAFAELLLVPMLACLFINRIGKIIPWIAAFCSACAWFNYGGLMHAPSFNTATAVLCLPVITNPRLVTLIVVTALIHHGATALSMLIAMAFIGVIRGRHGKRLLLFLAPVTALSLFLTRHQPMLNSGERISHWVQAMQFWLQDWHRIIYGVGPGSYVWYSIMEHPAQTGVYLQLHNDWLQVLWENGVIGFGLMAWVAAIAVRRSWGHLSVLQGVVGSMVFAFTYQPLRYFPSALLTAYFFAQALIVKDSHVEFAGLVWPVKSDGGQARGVTDS